MFSKFAARVAAYATLALSQEPEAVAAAALEAVDVAAGLAGASGEAKRQHAIKVLARKLDQAIDWRTVIPAPLVGAVAEILDGPIWRALAVVLVETAYRTRQQSAASPGTTPGSSPSSSTPEPRPGTKDAQILPFWDRFATDSDAQIAELAGVGARTVKRFRRRHALGD